MYPASKSPDGMCALIPHYQRGLKSLTGPQVLQEPVRPIRHQILFLALRGSHAASGNVLYSSSLAMSAQMTLAFLFAMATTVRFVPFRCMRSSAQRLCRLL